MLNALPSEGWQFWLYLRQSFLQGFLKSRWPSSNNYYPEILKLCCVSVTGSRCPPLTAGGTCCCTTPGPGAGAETTWTSSWTTAPSSGQLVLQKAASELHRAFSVIKNLRMGLFEALQVTSHHITADYAAKKDCFF